jgi:hypothetical protein
LIDHGRSADNILDNDHAFSYYDDRGGLDRPDFGSRRLFLANPIDFRVALALQ